jgi:hypothetical protein
LFLSLICYKFMSKYLEMKIFSYLKKLKHQKWWSHNNDINELLLLLLLYIFGVVQMMIIDKNI